jgi:hypothetical protein
MLESTWLLYRPLSKFPQRKSDTCFGLTFSITHNTSLPNSSSKSRREAPASRLSTEMRTLLFQYAIIRQNELNNNDKRSKVQCWRSNHFPLIQYKPDRYPKCLVIDLSKRFACPGFELRTGLAHIGKFVKWSSSYTDAKRHSSTALTLKKTTHTTVNIPAFVMIWSILALCNSEVVEARVRFRRWSWMGW